MGENYDGRSANKDIVLAPGEYTYIEDLTKGVIRVLVGPIVFSPTAQDQPVRFVMKGERPFQPVDHSQAIQKQAIAVEGMYLQLLNPVAHGGDQPKQGRHDTTPDLDVGRKVNIPGPVMFPLWPGQSAKLIKGHTLRSNQYLLVRIYNDEEAKANWDKAVIKAATEGEPTEAVVTSGAPDDLTVGKQYVIKGTEVSFYIPPTGVTVVQDDEGNYVREALTLERLEYCVLVNEQGDKRYERGPAVIFPEPNEKFIQDSRGNKKFRATELNPVQGIYVKVIADYTDETGVERQAGEELFITGKDTPIYFPREEHSLIKYDGKTKHFATAVPAGEGRYIMDRLTGQIHVSRGPAMELPDPRNQVFVHRVLSPKECALWYPGNNEALEYNIQLKDLKEESTHTRGAISDGDLKRALKKAKNRGSKGLVSAATSEAFFADQTVLGNSAQSFMPDEFERGSTYTQPRMLTLNTKYQGPPVVCPYTGYAVQVVSASGDRRTVLGPERILMEYDETLEVLTLSTGKPKNMDKPYETVYLRVKNNKVSDIVSVETSDHVQVNFKLSFLADFEESHKDKWFEVENYVKLLCDRVRSMLAGAAKKAAIASLYGNAIDFVRDTVLGTKEDNEGVALQSEGQKRTGLFFPECGLRVRDVEVLAVSITNADIARTLDQEQHAVVSENIQLERERRQLEFTREKQSIARLIQAENFETARVTAEFEAQRASLDLELTLSKLANEILTFQRKAEVFGAQAAADKTKLESTLDLRKAENDQTLAFERARQELRLKELAAEAEATVQKLDKFGPEFTSALTTLSTNQTLEQIAQALSAQQLIGGQNVTEVFSKVFQGFPNLTGYLKKHGLEAFSPKPADVTAEQPRNGSHS